MIPRSETTQTHESPKGAKCAECPFAKDGKPPHRPVLGVVPANATAILIGESPGAEEATEGIPFVGQTGRELDKELAMVGLARSKLAVINAVCCMPPPGVSDANKTKATRACNGAFARQLPQKLPTLAMGKQASFAFTLTTMKASKPMAIKKARGFLRKTTDGRPFIVTWHPTFAFFHSPFNWGAFSADLAHFAKLTRGELPEEPKTHVIHRVVDLKRLHKYLRMQPHVAVDIETRAAKHDEPWTGKQPTRARIRSIAFGTATEGWAMLWNNLHLRPYVRAILEDPRVLKVFHNGHWFDIPVLRRAGIKCINVMDTREMRKSLCATSELSLRYLGSVCTSIHPWKEAEASGKDDEK